MIAGMPPAVGIARSSKLPGVYGSTLPHLSYIYIPESRLREIPYYCKKCHSHPPIYALIFIFVHFILAGFIAGHRSFHIDAFTYI
jgi:hypothetical protein